MLRTTQNKDNDALMLGESLPGCSYIDPYVVPNVEVYEDTDQASALSVLKEILGVQCINDAFSPGIQDA